LQIKYYTVSTIKLKWKPRLSLKLHFSTKMPSKCEFDGNEASVSPFTTNKIVWHDHALFFQNITYAMI